MDTGKKNSPYLFAVVAGLLASLVSTNIARLVGAWNTDWAFLIISAVYIVIGLKLYISTKEHLSGPIGLVYVMVPFGVIIDCTFDWYVWGNDRNLFPFEIMLQMLFIWVPMLLGVGIGKLLGSNKSLKSGTPQSGAP